MSAWSEWKAGLITDDEYKSAMRREIDDYIDEHYDETYTDDPDDPHWRCENCAHCKTYHAMKPIIHFSNYVDDKGYVHNNPDKPVRQNLCAIWSRDKYVLANLCEVSNHQVLDDDYCSDFEEVEH